LIEADPFKHSVSRRLEMRGHVLARSTQGNCIAIERDGARILKLHGRELLSAYVVSDKGPSS